MALAGDGISHEEALTQISKVPDFAEVIRQNFERLIR
jgi:hypothetical protein